MTFDPPKKKRGVPRTSDQPSRRATDTLQMKRSFVLVVLLAALLTSVSGSANVAEGTGLRTAGLQTLNRDVLTQLNALRVTRGLRPLAASDELRQAALSHSRAMLDGGFFAHESKSAPSLSNRLRGYYRSAGYDSWSVGENLLYSTAALEAAAAIDAWLASPGHRKNMLDPNWREVGIGALYARSAGGTFGGGPVWIITAEFGARSNPR